MLVEQPISSSKDFAEVSRTINVVGININSDLATFDIYYRIKHIKDGKDVSGLFKSEVPDWHIDNSQLILCRDENFEAIKNPDFKEQKDEQNKMINENERYLTMPAFDYIKTLMLEKNVPLSTLISAYIIEEDKDGRFNF